MQTVEFLGKTMQRNGVNMVISKAYGCYIEDYSGLKLVDTTMGSGAQIIGHNNQLIKKIGEQIRRGTIYTIPNTHTEHVNFYLKNYINHNFHDEYVFCNSGTEANMRAIRLARAYTGKDTIARFHGGWHGGLDGFLAEHPNNKGVPDSINNLVKVLPYNDESCFEQITPDLAAVIIEPVQGSNPRSDIKPFLQKLRNRCDETGVLLIFDEVMTGFRLSHKGGAGIFHIESDIVTYGKVLGGGFPIGAVGARKEIMNTKGVFYGGTFSANPLSMYAAKLILKTIIDKKYIQYEHLNFVGDLFRNNLNQFFAEEGKTVRVTGCGPINRIIFTDKFIRNRKDRDNFELDQATQNSFYENLRKNGVFVNTNGLFHFSMSHTEDITMSVVDTIKENINKVTNY
jgi:glutamate-1-semialdehyde 2,1-aminomutase